MHRDRLHLLLGPTGHRKCRVGTTVDESFQKEASRPEPSKRWSQHPEIVSSTVVKIHFPACHPVLRFNCYGTFMNLLLSLLFNRVKNFFPLSFILLIRIKKNITSRYLLFCVR